MAGYYAGVYLAGYLGIAATGAGALSTKIDWLEQNADKAFKIAGQQSHSWEQVVGKARPAQFGPEALKYYTEEVLPIMQRVVDNATKVVEGNRSGILTKDYQMIVDGFQVWVRVATTSTGQVISTAGVN